MWIKDVLLAQHQYISPEDLDVFTIEDDPAVAVKIISDFREGEGRSGLELPPGMKNFNL